MKKLSLLAGILVVLAACSSNQEESNKEKDTVVASGDILAKADGTKTTDNTDTISSLCFLNTQGKDSTEVELMIKGDKVTGVMNWLPFQKDARKGKLEGVKHGETILATWSFMQEGMNDTLLVDFNLKNNSLTQRPLKLNKQTGRQQTDEKADYSIEYRPYGKPPGPLKGAK